MIRMVIIIFLVLTVSSNALAQPLTIDEAVKKALSRNQEILFLKRARKSTLMKLRASNAQRYGGLFFNGGFKKTGEEFIVYPMYKDAFKEGGKLPFDDEYFYYNFTYSIPIYTGGQITETVNLFRIILKQQDLKLNKAINDLVYNVKNAYLGLLVLDRKIDSVRTGIAAMDSVLEHIQEGVRAGKFARVDLLKARAKREEFFKLEATLVAERKSAYLNLLNLMGEDGIPQYKLISYGFHRLKEMHLPPVEELLKVALEQRSDLMILKKQVQAKESALQIKRSKHLPQITLNAGYNGVYAEGIGFEKEYYSVTLNLSIPLFTFGRLSNEYNSAKADRDAALSIYQLKKQEIRKEVMDAFSAFQKAKAVLVASEAELSLAKEVERIERLKYLNGKGRIDDLLFAISKTVEAEAGLFSAKVELYLAYENILKTIEGDPR